MNITEIAKSRYSTKAFDPHKKLTHDEAAQIKTLLRFSPSSTNIQPWHFIIADTEEGKARVAKGAQGGFQFNEAKILDAAQAIVFCSRTTPAVNDGYMNHLLSQEEKDGRFPNEEVKGMTYGARNRFSNIHVYDLKDHQHWMEKQVYLNMGNFLLGVAAIGLDAVPMEGLDLKALDDEFSLRDKGLTAVAVISVGHRTADDFNAPSKTPKSRLPESEIFTLL